MHTETIIAPATPPGEGGLAVVRISGPGAEAVLQEVFRPLRPRGRFRSHRLYLGQLCDPSGQSLDEVMAVIMRAPYSFTREDVVEIHCHGGPAIVRSVLDRCLALDGVRMARPGEFTQRAFLNGRLDLSQAEAVADLIHARSSGAARVALSQLQGRLARRIDDAHKQLVGILSRIELHIDFTDQDIDLPDLVPLGEQARSLAASIEALLDSFDAGRLLQEGARILILGKPNVGKSSLLNALLGEARAIVTDVAGTTRDTIEETLLVRDIPVRLIDTAGIRHTEDPVEREGVRRAREKASSADLVLLVVDGAAPRDADDRLALAAAPPERTLLVANKADRDSYPWEEAFAPLAKVAVSAKLGTGLDRLLDEVRQRLLAADVGSEHVLVYERRHRDALQLALAALARFVAGIERSSEAELLALELREAIAALGVISGQNVTDEVLDQIFAKFCIGK